MEQQNKTELLEVSQVLDLVDFSKIEEKLLELDSIINDNAKFGGTMNIDQAIGNITVNAIRDIPNRKSYKIVRELRAKVREELMNMYSDQIESIKEL